MLSLACLLRGLPLFLCASPRTPLRALCVIALDTIHVVRHAQPLSFRRRQEVSALLDFQACTNAVWDRKPLCAARYRSLRERLEQAGLGAWLAEYLCRLRELETRRPPIEGRRPCFDEVRAYRECVVRLSLATVAGVALDARCLDDAIRATQDDGDLAALWAMAMQCQIVDDVVDYRADLGSGLPSFLTACPCRTQAMALTAGAATAYGATHARSGGAVFPLEAALLALTVVTKLVVAAARFPR